MRNDYFFFFKLAPILLLLFGTCLEYAKRADETTALNKSK